MNVKWSVLSGTICILQAFLFFVIILTLHHNKILFNSVLIHHVMFSCIM